jgi:hypothetical protein
MATTGPKASLPSNPTVQRVRELLQNNAYNADDFINKLSLRGVKPSFVEIYF